MESLVARIEQIQAKSLDKDRSHKAESSDQDQENKSTEQSNKTSENITSDSGNNEILSEQRKFFLADLFSYKFKSDSASLEAPIFTLSTKKDLSVYEWRSKDGTKYLKVSPSVEYGRATQHDKDVLIYLVSQLTQGLNLNRNDASNRTIRFMASDLLDVTRRPKGGRGYKLLSQALKRLAGTLIETDIRTGSIRIRKGFGLIDGWEIVEKSETDNRMVAVEVTLSAWVYNSIRSFDVLTLHPDYFKLRKTLERRLYEIARKHCGNQKQWIIGVDQLLIKVGSNTTSKEFSRQLRAIVKTNNLPEYGLSIDKNKAIFYKKKRLSCSNKHFC